MPRITASSPLSPPRKDTMTKVVASRPASSVAPAPEATTPFATFLPTNLQGVPAKPPFTGNDGGTLLLDGKLNGKNARVRIDGAFGSQTRGQIFVKLAGGAERPMTTAELSDLQGAVKRFRQQESSKSQRSRVSEQLRYSSFESEISAGLAKFKG
jgi:hypothetical protein